MLLVLAVVAAWPLLKTILFSFTDASLGTIDDWRFVGFENFAWLAGDPVFWKALVNTIVFTLGSVTIETVIGVVIALVINAHMPGRGLMRAVILIPWAVPTVVAAEMWGWMYHDLYGVLNEIGLALGLLSEKLAWTANPDLAMVSVILADAWKTTPFVAVLALAALQMVPEELEEAARVDGVGPVQRFFRITLPLIWPALMVAVLFRSLDALRVFDVIYVLTANNQSTMSLSVFARQQLVDFQDVGYGSAVSTALFVMIAIFTVAFIALFRVRLTPEDGQ